MAIIEINNLVKEYRLGQIKGLKQSAVNAVKRAVGRPVDKRQSFKALDGIDFQVERGEVVGIIGTNGAGKSTLLKILASISTPTKGSVKVGGTVAPLIEVGAGLVGDLTGRENIFLNGSILGLSRQTIKKKFDEIVAFSELENFIDTPIKRYSSGMAVRLGFSIATSIDTDILIVDEVLAVGDLAFQRKCFDRMEELIKRQGKTVLLVSHNIRQVQRMCSRAILLDRGKVKVDGDPTEVCNLFYKNNNEKVYSYQNASQGKVVNIRTSEELELHSLDILDEQGQPLNEIEPGGRLRVRVRFKVNKHLKRPEFVIGTHTTDFVYLNSSTTAVFKDRPDYPEGMHELEYVIPFFPFVPGAYCIRFVVFDQNRRNVFEGETLKIFMVSADAGQVNEPGLRMLKLPAEWKLGGQKYCDSFSSQAQNF